MKEKNFSDRIERLEKELIKLKENHFCLQRQFLNTTKIISSLIAKFEKLT